MNFNILITNQEVGVGLADDWLGNVDPKSVITIITYINI